MKIKKTLAVLLASAMLALTACSEDTHGVPLTDDPVTTTTTTQATTTTTTRGTSAVTTAAEPKSSVNVDFKTYTYKMKDAQNYEYEITLTLSPWILDTQSDVLDSAWAKVGKGKNKPAINNMGAQKYANNVYTTQLSDSQGRNRTFYATMTNMYFSVGTMSVKNVTSGWDFSASKPGTPKIALNWVSDFTRGHNSGNYALMTKTFYSSTENTDIGELYAKPKMTKNTWGPVTVVLAHAENISPKYPGGQYADYVKSGYLLADWAVNETKITIPMYGSSSSASTTQAQTTTSSAPKAPSGVNSAADLMNLAGSVYNKDFDTAANTIAKSLNAKLGSYTDENYESSVGRTYDQNSNRLSIMGVAMSSMILESFKRDTSKCGLVSFHMSRYINGSTVPVVSAAQAKSAYDSLYKQFKAKYGEPTNTIEKTEAGSSERSDYTKYYWVEWNIPSTGVVWLCWGADLWNTKGYNSCIVSVSHPDRDKE
ncbi:MAG: hypothetical protein IJM32_04020 [Ruminococcus sp.]|nr:hypothetical protein [Ruminococcus sp.]